MDKNGKNKSQKHQRFPNPLEAMKDDLREIGTQTAKQMRDEATKISGDFMEQLLGIKTQPNMSGELVPGDSIEFSDAFSGQYEEVQKAKKEISFERRLLETERIQVEKKTNELRIQLHAIQEQVLVLAQKTESLADETVVAAMQAPIEPGVYHVIFFEKLLEFIKSFQRKIEEASTWLHAVNSRAAKKNAWGANYKKHGAKYLLSGEHYLQRSAG